MSSRRISKKRWARSVEFLFSAIRNARNHQRGEPEYEAAISVAYVCLIAGFITGSTYNRIADLLIYYRRPSVNHARDPKEGNRE